MSTVNSRLQTTPASTRYRAPSVACWAMRGFEGVFLVGGRPTGWAGVGKRWRRRGVWMIGVILQTCSQQQGPGMNIRLLNTMHVAKSIFCNAYLHPTQFGPLNF